MCGLCVHARRYAEPGLGLCPHISWLANRAFQPACAWHALVTASFLDNCQSSLGLICTATVVARPSIAPAIASLHDQCDTAPV
jgi:hypothetical protein